MTVTGSDLVARALRRQGGDTFFYIRGAPMLSVESAALALGLRGIDVRHEQAAAMAAGIPFYTTPQGRGAIPEDHELCYLTARSTAFREADLILIVGTRM